MTRINNIRELHNELGFIPIANSVWSIKRDKIEFKSNFKTNIISAGLYSNDSDAGDLEARINYNALKLSFIREAISHLNPDEVTSDYILKSKLEAARFFDLAIKLYGRVL
jgi:hypothetical protein